MLLKPSMTYRLNRRVKQLPSTFATISCWSKLDVEHYLTQELEDSLVMFKWVGFTGLKAASNKGKYEFYINEYIDNGSDNPIFIIYNKKLLTIYARAYTMGDTLELTRESDSLTWVNITNPKHSELIDKVLKSEFKSRY